MTTMHTDVFSQMKNEDRQFGERHGKSPKVKAKGPKHRGEFKNFKPQDIINMSEDYDLEAEEQLEEA